ncbi:MAG: hypothetical protein FWG90_07965 [Oscillospiraceae bacterium]|nr:hypothetical protein [Oscillospiraceae bacterium]
MNNGNVEKAKEVLKKANREFTDLCRIIAEEVPIDKDALQIYRTTAELNILTSQLIDKDEPRTYEGAIEVNNRQAMVSIKDIEIRGSIEFEIEQEGNWVRGRRENSQYGQIFIGDGISLILSDGMKGRVSLPLKEYK